MILIKLRFLPLFVFWALYKLMLLSRLLRDLERRYLLRDELMSFFILPLDFFLVDIDFFKLIYR
jgi:hypothetical protein